MGKYRKDVKISQQYRHLKYSHMAINYSLFFQLKKTHLKLTIKQNTSYLNIQQHMTPIKFLRHDLIS